MSHTNLQTMRLRMAGFALLFFLYGCSVHALLLWGYVRLAYRPPADASFVSDPVTNAGVVILGGTFVAWLALSLLRYAREPGNIRRYAIILRGASYGILATVLTLESFYFLTAILIATGSAGFGEGIGSIDLFALSLISIQTYGTVPIMFSLPFDALYGALAGAAILRIRKYLPPAPMPASTPSRTARTSLAFGALGLVSFWLPGVGVVSSTLAVLLGLVALRRIKEGQATGKNKAMLGIALGILGFCALLVLILYARRTF